MKISKKKNLNKYVITIMKKKATMIWIFIIIPKKHSKPNKNSLEYLVAKKIKSPIGKHITNNYTNSKSIRTKMILFLKTILIYSSKTRSDQKCH